MLGPSSKSVVNEFCGRAIGCELNVVTFENGALVDIRSTISGKLFRAVFRFNSHNFYAVFIDTKTYVVIGDVYAINSF